MATNYKNYAENLIGNWNTDQYEPQRDVLKASYSTNWDRLQNDFATYMDKLNRNLRLARTNYYDSLAKSAENNYLRTNAAIESLSNKGLLGSGLAEKYVGSNIANRGQEVSNALEDLVNRQASYEGSLGNMVSSISEKESKLNQNLAKAFGKVTDAEEDNAQNYANLVASLAGSAEAREMSNALAAARIALSGGNKEKQEKNEELARRKRIYDTLASDSMSDIEKVRNMANYLDVPAKIGEELLEAYKNNQNVIKQREINNKQNEKIEKYQEALENLPKISKDQTYIGMSAWGDLKDLLGIPRFDADYRTNAMEDFYNNKIRDARSKINEDIDYIDLYNILYGNK